MNLKLTLDFIPIPLYYQTLCQYYQHHGKRDWLKIKNKIIETEGNHCWICKSKEGTLEAHEYFNYDEENKTQKLTGIHHLCKMCHMVKHFGLWTSILTDTLKRMGLTKQDLINHFCKVNGCSEKEFNEHSAQCFEEYYRRNEIEWKQDFSYVNSLGLNIQIPENLAEYLKNHNPKSH